MPGPRRRVTYDHLILFDFTPIPPFQHVSCMPIGKSGLDAETANNLLLTRQVRLLQRRLRIYEDQHNYLILAKTDADCDNVDRGRAVSVINDFVYTKLKDGVRIDQLPELLVDTFDSRVIKLVPYVPKYEQETSIPRTGYTARKRPIFSSDHEEVTAKAPPKKTTRVPPKVAKQKKVMTVPVSDSGALPPAGARVIADGGSITREVKMSQGLTPVFVQEEAGDKGEPNHTGAAEQRDPPDVSPLVTSPSIPDSGDPGNNGGFNTPNNDGFNTPTAIRRHRSTNSGKDSPLQTILIRLDNADQTGTRRYTKLAGALKFLTNTAETMAGDIAELRQSVRDLQAKAVANEATTRVPFPLKSKQEVYNYVSNDPTMKQAIERYVRGKQFVNIPIHISFSFI